MVFVWHGSYTLFNAAAEGNLELVEVLISYNADVNIKCELKGYVFTALEAATFMGHTDIVKYLSLSTY